jgi:hypothetical protein
VIYLSPNDESRRRLEGLRETLRRELFGEYDAFSPASPVSPHPERLPRRRSGGGEEGEEGATFRPLLPVGRFATVNDAVRVARAMQRSWDPLRFNVTDLQFVSRRGADDILGDFAYDGIATTAAVGGSADVGPMPTSRTTTSGEVDDVSRRGVYGCDAMVMLRGEEPEELSMEDEASMSMIMMDADADSGDDEDGGGGETINYDEIFSTAEREYQRMRAHEDTSSATITQSSNDDDDHATTATTTDIEALLDDDADDLLRDEGATVVIGRAQFFMGAMREFVG